MSDILPGLQLFSSASVTPNALQGGVVLAQTRVATFLSLAVPNYAPSFFSYMGLPEPSPYGPNYLPIPTGGSLGAGYYDYEPPVLDAGNMPFDPAKSAAALIYVASNSTPKFIQRQQDNLANPQWDVYYSMSATCWVRSRTISQKVNINATKEAWRVCSKGRSNLVTLMRACFLLHPDMGTLDTCYVDNSTFNEERAMPIQSKGATFIAGGSLNFRMRQRETLTVAPDGTVTHINIDEPLLPVHPALIPPTYNNPPIPEAP